MTRNIRSNLMTVALLACCIRASAVDIALPQDNTSYQPNDLPGYPLVLKNCLTCHSSQYVQTQPPRSPRRYWEATVHKMKDAFGAPVDDAEIPAIVDYLTKTYGAEASPSPSQVAK